MSQYLKTYNWMYTGTFFWSLDSNGLSS